MMKIDKLFYLALSTVIAMVNCVVMFSVSVSAAAVTPEANNIYYIKNVNSGLYLQVEGDSTSNGANVCQASGTGSSGQKWIINDNGDGTIRLKSALDLTGGIALDVPNGDSANLVSIGTWASNGLSPQNFKLYDNGDGSYAILTQVSDFTRALDVLNYSTADGADVIQYDAAYGANQLWYFEKASWPSSSSNTTTTTTTTTKATTTTTEATTQATTAASSSSSSSSSSTSWNFSNSAFRNLGTISSTTTVNSLGLVATSSKTMSVIESSATVGSTNYTYALALGGSGSTTYRAVKFTASGATTLKVTAVSSGSSARTLAVVGANGTSLGTISAGTTAAVGSVTFTYTGDVYIYSTGSGINIYKVQADKKTSTAVETTTQATTKATTQTTTKSTTTQTTTTSSSSSNSKTVTNFTDLVSAVKTMASTSGGGTVYVNAKSIDCTAQLALNSTKGNPVAIVGVKQSDGTYPILDFKSLRDSKVGSSAGSLKGSNDDGVGVRITGSYYTLKNLIIQKAADNGIQIKGKGADHNTVENCIVRYNNDAGVQITNYASYNTMRFVYNYRNCDVYTEGGNADGFAPKLGATTGNTFYGCYAWDNSDDAWDSYDKTDSGYTYDLDYQWCACWNNGNPDVFTGKYDFDNGKSLDKNLFLVELINAQDSSFATNYAKGKFSLPSDKFINTENGKVSASTWASTGYEGNDNGFKFGSINTKSDCVRTVKNCLSFNHGCKGFDNNNSSATGYFENCISFDNKYNYYMPPFTIKKFSNVYGFNGGSKDSLPSGYSASTPSSSTQSSIRSKVNSTVDTIVTKCDSNIIPGEVYFNIF